MSRYVSKEPAPRLEFSSWGCGCPCMLLEYSFGLIVDSSRSIELYSFSFNVGDNDSYEERKEMQRIAAKYGFEIDGFWDDKIVSLSPEKAEELWNLSQMKEC